jgi:hypothetical protein
LTMGISGAFPLTMTTWKRGFFPFIVFCQPQVAIQPGKTAFDHPSARSYGEAMRLWPALNHR